MNYIGWSVGQGIQYFPPQAGFVPPLPPRAPHHCGNISLRGRLPLGGGIAETIIIQMHNNNAAFQAGVRDYSGFRYACAALTLHAVKYVV